MKITLLFYLSSKFWIVHFKWLLNKFTWEFLPGRFRGRNRGFRRRLCPLFWELSLSFGSPLAPPFPLSPDLLGRWRKLRLKKRRRLPPFCALPRGAPSSQVVSPPSPESSALPSWPWLRGPRFRRKLFRRGLKRRFGYKNKYDKICWRFLQKLWSIKTIQW